MTPEQYRRVQDVFLRIRDLPESERASSLLDEEDDIRREVDSLLRSERLCGDFLEPHPIGNEKSELERVVGDSPTRTHEPRMNFNLQQVGKYRLLQKIGEGGQGAVYMAEQQEPIKTQGRHQVDQIRNGFQAGPCSF